MIACFEVGGVFVNLKLSFAICIRKCSFIIIPSVYWQGFQNEIFMDDSARFVHTKFRSCSKKVMH